MRFEEIRDKLAAPARRALEGAGIGSLAELLKRSAEELRALHGMGPKALEIIEAELAAAGKRLATPRTGRAPKSEGPAGGGGLASKRGKAGTNPRAPAREPRVAAAEGASEKGAAATPGAGAGAAEVEAYIASKPAEQRRLLERVRRLIREEVPEARELLSYGMPAFHFKGNLVYYAPAKAHLGFYPTASGIAAFEAELGAYAHSKGAIQFPYDSPLPEELIRRIVRFRRDENLRKKK